MRDSVTPDDLEAVVAAAASFTGDAAEADWSALAGDLSWTCWETAEHVADDLFSYAAQLGPKPPPSERYTPIVWRHGREGGPAQTIFAEPEAGISGLVQVLEACGALLSAMVRVTPPQVRGWHPAGISDPEGFAAMGIVEILVHYHDIAIGLGGLAWEPDGKIAKRTLDRLFPDAPKDVSPAQALLWCSGRIALPGRERLAGWRWDSTVRQ
jgi:hypothetical protein